MSTIGFITFTFCHMPLGTAGGLGVVAFVAIGEATGDATGDSVGAVSAFCHFEANVAALASATDLFLDGTPPRVHTILRLTKRKNKETMVVST